jgi:HAD superfamily hydrolase (TIGR01490 family)
MPNEIVIFSDVDETIIRSKSLLGFAEYLARTLPAAEAAELRAFVGALLVKFRAGESRTELNRAYYAGVLAGRAVDTVRAVVTQWYEESLLHANFFKRSVCEFLADSRRRGAKIVLLSGSFRELIAPVAEVVGASDVIAAPLELKDGRYTGKLLAPPTVEDGKADALLRYAQREGLELANCGGVADDVSDLAFLRLLGRRFVPADGAHQLVCHALQFRWHLISESAQQEPAASQRDPTASQQAP